MTVNLPRTVAVAALMLIAFPVQANDTGLSVLHALRREGGRTCFFDHYHYGDSSGKKTERAAKAGAVEFVGRLRRARVRQRLGQFLTCA